MAFGSSIFEDESQETFRRQSKEAAGNEKRSFGIVKRGLSGTTTDGFERGLGKGRGVSEEGLRTVGSSAVIENENV
jgi:hypothetical protein